ncbi:hypothetical protein LTR50_004054 [Elasticomyces elasticus]|nr:hypothetical protein LTR50_004054 [Elasticomyces elasticus]
MVEMGEIVTERDDMLYGSFRVGMKTTGVPGTCAAFFWYRNDTQEIDLEFLSSQLNTSLSTSPLNLVVQSPLSASLGYNAAPTPGFKLYPLPFRPDTGYHEYRFDWRPSRIDFYADGAWLHAFIDDGSGGGASVPDAPGRLVINHWSNGDAGWSAGPPATDAVLSVSYVKAYFNSSDAARRARYESVCGGGRAAEWVRRRTCEVPEQRTPPEVRGEGGNVTGRTFFFTGEGEGGGRVVYGGVGGRGRGKGKGWSGGVGVVGLVLTVVLFVLS